jgi:DNA-binding transcriptional LysR family regulator
MNERQLTYFSAIAREANITKAAEKLNIPQPYLSNQLKLLEEEVGVKLADRSTRRFRLTDAGKHLQYRASQILDLMSITTTELNEFDGGFHGTIKIGTTATPSAIVLPQKLYQFYLKYPNIKFDVQTLQPSHIIESLKIGLIEIGVLRTPIDNETFNSIKLGPYPMVAVTAKGSLKNILRDTMEISDLMDKTLMLSHRLEPLIVEECRNAGFTPNILCRIDDSRTLIICASLGMGITILQKDWLDLIPGLSFDYKLLNASQLSTSSALIWMKNRRMSTAAMNFLNIFKEG